MTGLITSMGRAITSVAFTGFGFQAIGLGVTTTESGSTAITHHANLGTLTFGPIENIDFADFLKQSYYALYDIILRH